MLVRSQLTNHLQLAWVGFHIAHSADIVDDYAIHVIGEQGQDGGGELVERADALHGEVLLGDDLVGGADLGADQLGLISYEVFQCGSLIDTYQQHLADGDVRDGVVDDLGALFGDGDAISEPVELTGFHGGEDAVPGGFLEDRRAVDEFTDSPYGVVIPTDGFAGILIDGVEGWVGVFHRNGDLLSTQVG